MAVDQQRIADACELALLMSQNMLVPWYLILSYAYYHLNESLVSDEVYDSVCKLLLDEMDQFNVEHEHMHLIDTAALRAGTAFHLKREQYPLRVVRVAEGMVSGIYP